MENKILLEIKKVFDIKTINNGRASDLYTNNDRLQIGDPYTHYTFGENEICLDGHYNIDQLKVLIKFMKSKGAK